MRGQKPFEEEFLELLPALRAFSRSLSRDPSTADDLVQETITRAWEKQDQFQPGTNLRAWLFTILRNTFYSRMRTQGREVDDPDGHILSNVASPPTQIAHIEYQDFLRAFETLTPEHREVLILVGASGLTYEEAAEVCGVAVGTVKSRVNRARAALVAETERTVSPVTAH